MRNKNKAFLSCAVVAVAGLLAAPAAMATGYTSCTSFLPTITILAGPCPVDSALPSACAVSGPYTGIKYKITGSPDHVATVVTANNTVLVPSGFQAYAVCAGDPVTGLGKQSCHEKAVKVNPNAAAAGEFWLVVEQQKAAILQSMVAKKGNCTKPFAIAGLGFDTNPFQQVQKTETVKFKGCSVNFFYDTVTGAFLNAALASGSPSSCSLYESNVQTLNMTTQATSGPPIGTCTPSPTTPCTLDLPDGKFGEGYISSGSASCTTRVIGGRVYTWGDPCPE